MKVISPAVMVEASLRGLSQTLTVDELMQRIWQFAVLIGAALAQPTRYLFGNVANPAFREVKANDADRVSVLAFQQILDDSFKIGVFHVCLAPGTTHSAEVVEDQIDIPVDAGDNRW
jgi:hypothetical protein